MGAARAMRRRAPLVILALLAGMLALWSGGIARAQAPAAQFVYAVYAPGWNLVSFGDLDSLAISGSGASPIDGPLYTFQPGDRDYEQTTLDRVKTGNGYWAHFNQTFSVLLDTSGTNTYQVSVPGGGTCIIVGNPSTLGSARVSGADRVYQFSALGNSYIDGNLIGIGRGAWACNDSPQTRTVIVAYQQNPTPVSWPDCCQPTPVSNGGRGAVVIKNDSPAPLIVGIRQIDASGAPVSPLTEFNFLRAGIPACDSCPEYTNWNGCNPRATTVSINLTPGSYTLHLQSDDSFVDDFVIPITISPDTSYSLCFFVSANRPR